MMKTFGISGLALASALAFAAPASAGDLFKREASVKDAPAASPCCEFSWGGFYAGASVGVADATFDGKLKAEVEDKEREPYSGHYLNDTEGTGSVFGVHAGYNWQRGSWVFGGEIGYNWLDTEGNGKIVDEIFWPYLQSKREIEAIAEVVGRIGYAAGKTMFYVRGGWVWAELDSGFDHAYGGSVFNGDDTADGTIWGVGVEHALSPHLIVRVQYDHIDLDENDLRLKVSHRVYGECYDCKIRARDDLDTEIDMIRIGASYKFGDRRAPVEQPLK